MILNMPIVKHLLFWGGIFLLSSTSLRASESMVLYEISDGYKIDSVTITSPKEKKIQYWATKLKAKYPANKFIAIVFAVFTGPLGGHRIYLGTSVEVPIIYTLTIGGGFGALPLADIVAILITPDLTRYVNNPHVFMWITETDDTP